MNSVCIGVERHWNAFEPCLIADGIGTKAQFCAPHHVKITPHAATAWIWSKPKDYYSYNFGVLGVPRNISLATGKVPAGASSSFCESATLEECKVYASNQVPWQLPIPEIESCNVPSGCLLQRDETERNPSLVTFNKCTVRPEESDAEPHAAPESWKSRICVDGISPWPARVSDRSNGNRHALQRGQLGTIVLFQKSVWKNSVDFSGSETVLSWNRGAQYRSNAAGVGVGIVGNRIFKFDLLQPVGSFATLAGFWGGSSHLNGGYADGVGTDAVFNGVQDLAVTPDGNSVIEANTTNNCLRRITIRTGETNTFAGVCGSPTYSITDGIGSQATFWMPESFVIVPPRADVLTESELMIVMPQTLPGFTVRPSDPWTLMRLVDAASGKVTTLQSSFRVTNSPMLIGSALVLAGLHSLRAVVVRDHCRVHARGGLDIDAPCTCNAGFNDSPSVLDQNLFNAGGRHHACVPCAPGTYKPTGFEKCSTCPVSTYSGEASKWCHLCNRPLHEDITFYQGRMNSSCIWPVGTKSQFNFFETNLD